MNILHFILGKANKDRANGVNHVIHGLAKYTKRNGCDIKVLGLAESAEGQGEIVYRDGFDVKIYTHWSLEFKKELEKLIKWADLIHLHGVYSLWNIYVSRMCLKLSKPYIVTLHDGLSPIRASRKRKYLKIIFHYLVQKKFLESASAIHTLTEEETTDLLNLISPKKIFCIPNGIDREDYILKANKNKKRQELKKIGYLGRLSSEKNLDNLCNAFKSLEKEHDIELIIAGPESKYGRYLQKKYRLSKIKWVGSKFGNEKYKFLEELDLFVHPSKCDVFSISAMEALAFGTPLLITRTSNASYFYNEQAFFMCEPTKYGLEGGIRTAIDSSSNLENFSLNGRRLIENKFNWDIVSKKMVLAYKSILG